MWTAALARAEPTSPRLTAELMGWILWDAWWSTNTSSEGIALCNQFLEQGELPTSKRFEAMALAIRGVLRSYLGEFDEARADLRAGRALLRDLGDTIWWAGTCTLESELELAAGNPQAAYDVLAEGRETLAAYAETGYLATAVGMLSQAALELGREDEALELADEAVRLAQKDDFEPHARSRLVRARILARRGDIERAEELLGEAAELIDATDYAFLYIEVGDAASEVHRLAGNADAERAALEKALGAAQQKEHRVAEKRIRARLAEL